jgi:6-phosphofructokinase 1
MLTGSGKMLENFVRDRFGVKVRSIELNVSQRCSGMLASAVDIEESVQAGIKGVKTALEGITGMMIAFKRTADSPYTMECVTVDVNEVCNKEKLFPYEWISKNGTDVTDDFLTYALPLIQGEPERKMEGGRPVYLYRK